MASIKEISSNKCHGGFQKAFSHSSQTVGCEMKFSVYLPPQAQKGDKCPVLLWLSGLTCNELNFVQKAAFQESAAEYGFIVVCPDTSPRGLNIAGDSDAWDFGVGAGFYVNATQDPWAKNYQMYSYVTEELYNLVNSSFPTQPEKWGVFGHSMGGHGALICYLKNPHKFKTVSAFSPICNPINCAWGKKAFTGYLGADVAKWKQWDATELATTYDGPEVEILIDQGEEDGFLKDGQLLPENINKATVDNPKVVVDIQRREGYDHSYFYIQSFVSDHFEHHYKYLVEEDVDNARLKEFYKKIEAKKTAADAIKNAGQV